MVWNNINACLTTTSIRKLARRHDSCPFAARAYQVVFQVLNLQGEVVQMNRKGFTLIELLIVVVIIGILAAIAIPKFANTKEKAYLASMKSDLRNLVTAEEAYFADSVKYTTNLGTAYATTSGVEIGRVEV